MFVHRNLLGLSRQLADRVAIGAAVGLAIAACDISQAVLASMVIADTVSGGDLPGASLKLAAIGVIIVVRGGLVFTREVVARQTGYLVKRRIRLRLFNHLAAVGPSSIMDDRTGDLVSTCVDAVEHLEPYCARYLPTLVVAVVSTMILVCGIAWLNIWLAICMVFFVLLTPVLPLAWSRAFDRQNRDRWRLWPELLSEFVDAIQGVTTLKIFNAAEWKRDDLLHRSLALYSSQMARLYLALVVESLTVLASYGGAAALIASGALLVSTGQIDVAALIFVLLISREAFRPWVDLTTYWHMGIDANLGAEKIARLLSVQPHVRDGAMYADTKSATSPTITFKDISFSYPSRRSLVIADFNLTIEAGQKIGVVGPSGCGKSTLVSLLLRFYDPAAGQILIEGQPISEQPLHRLREQVALVSQDTYLFAGTIEDNIALGREGASPEEIRQAAIDANIDDFVRQLPLGYQTQISERGNTLSGGQRQRLAIARAFLKNAPILVLDEATSNVDLESERAIQRSIAKLTAGRTSIIIAHRMSSIVDVDRVVTMSEGRIVSAVLHDAPWRSGGGRGEEARQP